MAQLSLFSETESVEIIVPEDVISPLESNKGVKTKAFRDIQKQWSRYVQAVQDYEKCPWNDAREKVLEHRLKQLPLRVIWGGD